MKFHHDVPALETASHGLNPLKTWAGLNVSSLNCGCRVLCPAVGELTPRSLLSLRLEGTLSLSLCVCISQEPQSLWPTVLGSEPHLSSEENCIEVAQWEKGPQRHGTKGHGESLSISFLLLLLCLGVLRAGSKGLWLEWGSVKDRDAEPLVPESTGS